MAEVFNYGVPLQGSSPNTTAGTTVVSGGLLTPVLNIGGADGQSTSASAEASLRAYGIDIYNDIKYHKTEKHPTLSLLGAGATSVDHFEFLVSETYEYEQYMDTQFDNIRRRQVGSTTNMTKSLDYYNRQNGSALVSNGAPNAITDSSYGNAGALRWTLITGEQTATTGTLALLKAGEAAGTSTTTNAALTTATEAITTLAVAGTPAAVYGTAHSFGMGYKYNASYPVQGNVANLIEEWRANLTGLGYAASHASGVTFESGGTPDVWYGVYRSTSSNTFMYMFDNLAMYSVTGGVKTAYQFSGVKMPVKAFWWNASLNSFIIVIDADQTNIEIDWTASTDYFFQLKEYSQGEVFTAALTTEGVTYHSPVGLMGDITDYVQGIPEGSSPIPGQSFKRNFGGKSNYTQIFLQPFWSLTRTKAASRTSRFIDEWKDTRDRNLSMYKDKIAGQMLWGVKSQASVLAPAGSPNAGKYETVRTMGGLLDRELWPIRYFKYRLPSIGSTASESSVNLTQFMDDFADAHTSFMTDKKNKNITVVCSPSLIRDFRRIAAHAQSFGPNIFGYAATGAVQKGTMELGFDVTSFKTAYGTLNFVEDPALEYMTKFNLPYGITTSAIAPKKIAFVLDLGSIKMRTLTPDRLRGNLMLPGEDIALKEDIIGEHSLEVTKARHQSLVIFE